MSQRDERDGQNAGGGQGGQDAGGGRAGRDAQASEAVTTIAAGRFLRLARRGTWEFVERLGASGAVCIIAVTDERKLVLIEQPRPAMNGPVIELPAGLVGDGE